MPASATVCTGWAGWPMPLPEIAEIDVNPLVVTAQRQRGAGRADPDPGPPGRVPERPDGALSRGGDPCLGRRAGGRGCEGGTAARPAHPRTRPGGRTRSARARAPWSRPAAEVAEELGVDPRTGLDDATAAARLAADGPNEVASRRPRSLLRSVLAQLTDILILVLIGAAVLTALTGDFVDCAVIVLVIMVNTTLGVVQERGRSGRSVRSRPSWRRTRGWSAAAGTSGCPRGTWSAATSCG